MDTYKKYFAKYYTSTYLKQMVDVYILKQPVADGGFIVKIGKSNNYLTRLKQHKTSNPLIEYVTHYKAFGNLETQLHAYLNEHLLDGCTEWFKYYEGMFEDIQRFIDDGDKILYTLDEFVEDQYSILNVRLWKLKSIFNNGFIFVICPTLDKAIDHVKQNYSLIVEYHSDKFARDFFSDIPLEPYVTHNTIPQPKFKPFTKRVKKDPWKKWDDIKKKRSC